MKRRRMDPVTATALKAAVKQALDTEQQQTDAEHKEMIERVLGHMDRFIEGEDDGRPDA
jgi:trehalose-6-phosphate synthase